MTTGKTIALTRRTFAGKVMSLLFNRLSRLVITFLPRSKRLLISWLQSPSAVILEPPNINIINILYSSVIGHLGCIHILNIVNNVIKMVVEINLLNLHFNSFGYILKSGIA